MALTLYVLVAFFYWMALYLYVSPYPAHLRRARSAIWPSWGRSLSMYGLWQALVRLPLGIAADWVGLAQALYHNLSYPQLEWEPGCWAGPRQPMGC
ncbi:MAG: hypothetical protein U0401_21750 [Anaerolineae bacterium]